MSIWISFVLVFVIVGAVVVLVGLQSSTQTRTVLTRQEIRAIQATNMLTRSPIVRLAARIEHAVQDSLWQPHLHELGEIEVKHGAKLGIVNLYTAELGNPQPPEKLSHIAAAQKLPSVPSAQKSIAALAFVNMSNDPDNEYFSDGIAEEIINVQFRLRCFVWMSKERYKRSSFLRIQLTNPCWREFSMESCC